MLLIYKNIAVQKRNNFQFVDFLINKMLLNENVFIIYFLNITIQFTSRLDILSLKFLSLSQNEDIFAWARTLAFVIKKHEVAVKDGG